MFGSVCFGSEYSDAHFVAEPIKHADDKCENWLTDVDADYQSRSGLLQRSWVPASSAAECWNSRGRSGQTALLRSA